MKHLKRILIDQNGHLFRLIFTWRDTNDSQFGRPDLHDEVRLELPSYDSIKAEAEHWERKTGITPFDLVEFDSLLPEQEA